MDQNDVKASGAVNDDRNLHSPEQKDLLGRETSLIDSCGVVSIANSGSEKQKHPSTSERKTNSCESSKFEDMERKCLDNDCSSSADSAKVNTDELKLSSAVVSPSRNSDLKRDNCVERASSAMLHCNLPTGSASLKDFNVSACSSRGADSMQNFTTLSDVSSEGSKLGGKESDEFIAGRMNEFWLGDTEDGLKSMMQVSGHNKRLKTESSYDSTNIALSASSDDSCLEMLLDVKSCELIKHSYKNSSRFTDFKGSLEASAVKNSVLALGVQMGMKDGSLVVGSNQKHRPMQTVDSFGRRDCDKLSETAEDSNIMNVGAGVIWKIDLHKKENEEIPKIKAFCEPADALVVARRVAKEVEQEVGIYKEASEGCSWVQERSGESGQGSDDSAGPGKDYYADTGSRNLPGSQQDNRDTVCSTKDEADPEMSMRSERLCLDVKELSQSTGSIKKNQPNESLHGRVLSHLTNKPEDITVNGQFTGVSRFNLNENIIMDEVDNIKQSVTGLSPCNADVVSKPIPVVAKFGIPLCLPESRLLLDETENGWMGSSSNSAFRSTSFPESISYMKSSSAGGVNNNGSKSYQGIGIDLNIAAEGLDCDGEYLPEKYAQQQSSFPKLSMEPSSTRKERFDIDLNYVQENDDPSHQPTSLSRQSGRGFDLNDNPTLADVCSDTQQPGQGTAVLGDKLFGDHAVKFSGNVSKPDSKRVGSSYWVDSRYMQSYSNGNAKPVMIDVPNILPPVEHMQNLVSLQHRSSYRAIPPPTPPPPRAFSYGNAFFIDPNNRLFSTIYTPSVIPYVIDPRAAPVFPQISTSGPHPGISGAPHLMQVPGGPINSEMAITRPSFNVDGRVTSSNCGFQGENGRQWFVPVSIARTEGQMQSLQQQPTLPATPMKRKELEGVSDSHHLGFRPMTAWP